MHPHPSRAVFAALLLSLLACALGCKDRKTITPSTTNTNTNTNTATNTGDDSETLTTATTATARADRADDQQDKAAPDGPLDHALLEVRCPSPRGRHYVFNSVEELSKGVESMRSADADLGDCDRKALESAVDFSKKTLILARITGSGCSHEIKREVKREEGQVVVHLTYIEEGGCEPFNLDDNAIVIDKVDDPTKIRVERSKISKRDP